MENVYTVTGKMVSQLSKTLQTSSAKAILANLRNSIGRNLSQSMNVLSFILENMPKESLGYGGELNAKERGIFNTLQIYALHQQGKTQSVNSEKSENEYSKNIGSSLREYRLMNTEKTAIDRRFNAMITASTYDELIIHLRHLVKILKSKSEIKIDYPKLASDLCYYLSSPEHQEEIKLVWSRSYYTQQKENQHDEKD